MQRNKKNSALVALLWIVLAFVCIWFLNPQFFSDVLKPINNKRNTFNITVEVKEIYKKSQYSIPCMKCEIIGIDRSNYQKNHILTNEPEIGDTIYIRELHGDLYGVCEKIQLTVMSGNPLVIKGGQFENVTDLYVEPLAINPNTNNSNTNKFDDVHMINKASITDSIGLFVYDYKDMIPDDQESNIEEYIEEKYIDSGVRVYIIYYDTNDSDYIINHTNEMLDLATSPAIAYVRNNNDSAWYVRWCVPSEKSDVLNAKYERIADAYLINGNYETRLKNVVDKAYEIYLQD